MTAADRILRFGIAGLGPGAMTLLGGFASNPHVKLVAAADVRQQAVEDFGKDYGIETFTSVEAMCSSPNVDAVYVVTPTPFHAEHVITAAEHGKHIIVSKPMAVTQEECDAMTAAAERNGVKFVCGHTQSLLTPSSKWPSLFGVVSSGVLACCTPGTTRTGSTVLDGPMSSMSTSAAASFTGSRRTKSTSCA